jgi:hypothetical protein
MQLSFISASSVNATGGELAPLDCSDGASVSSEKWVELQLSWEVGVMTRRNASLEIRHVTGRGWDLRRRMQQRFAS